MIFLFALVIYVVIVAALVCSVSAASFAPGGSDLSGMPNWKARLAAFLLSLFALVMAVAAADVVRP